MSPNTTTSTDSTAADAPGAGTAPVAWFEIAGPDMAALEGFYADVFGWKFADSPMGASYRIADNGGLSGGLTSSEDGLPAHYAIFSLQVADVAATCETISAAGGSVLLGPAETPMGLVYANVTDPAGNHLGLFSAPAG
ncbi:MAG: VOC family protein [Acidimicrobiales bacterium]